MENGQSPSPARPGLEGVIMSFGKMNTEISIIQKQNDIDNDGFNIQSAIVLATVQAYREGRHNSEKWINRASFTDATDLFRFRCIPGITPNTDMMLKTSGSLFEITSVENVKGRNMYLEVLAKEVKPSGKNQNQDA